MKKISLPLIYSALVNKRRAASRIYTIVFRALNTHWTLNEWEFVRIFLNTTLSAFQNNRTEQGWIEQERKIPQMCVFCIFQLPTRHYTLYTLFFFILNTRWIGAIILLLSIHVNKITWKYFTFHLNYFFLASFTLISPTHSFHLPHNN